MALSVWLDQVGSYAPASYEDIRKNLDPDWIENALNATGTATVRRRRLPAEQVIWLVIGMALLRRRGITAVAKCLDLVLPGVKLTAAPSSISDARARLGDEPMLWLFARCADVWAHASAAADRWHGLALYIVDGTKLNVPETPQNSEKYEKWTGGGGTSGYPLMRLVTLIAARSRLIAAAEFGPYTVAETVYAASLWRHLPKKSLVILDGLYHAATAVLSIASVKERHWLLRARKNVKYRAFKQIGEGDALVVLRTSAEAREADPTLPKTWTARAITYQRKGFPPRTLLTSLLDPIAFPAAEVAALYHERWEIELGFGDMKTKMLGGAPVLRSKSPKLLHQEIWGVLLAYNLVRLEMAKAAAEAGVPPSRISFSNALLLIVDEWLCCSASSPGAIPKHLRDLRADLVDLVIPPRRSARQYPRAVKVRTSPYPTKRPPRR